MKPIDSIVTGNTANASSAQVLQWEGKCAVQWYRQHWLEEHAEGRIFVVFNQSQNCWR